MTKKYSTFQTLYLISQIFFGVIFFLNLFIFELPKQYYYFLMSAIFVLDVITGLFIALKFKLTEGVNLKILKVLTVIMSLAFLAQFVAVLFMKPFMMQDNLIAVFSFIDFLGFIVYNFKFGWKFYNLENFSNQNLSNNK